MERTLAVGEPVGIADRDLDRPAETRLDMFERAVEAIPVGFAEHEQIDVLDRSWPLGAQEPCRPGAIHECARDPLDRSQRVGKNARHPERPRQHLSEPIEVGTRSVSPDQAGVPDLPGRHQARSLSTLDLSMHRRIWRPDAGGEVGQAELELGIAEEQSEELNLLTGTENGEEDRRRSLIHNLDYTSRSADITEATG